MAEFFSSVVSYRVQSKKINNLGFNNNEKNYNNNNINNNKKKQIIIIIKIVIIVIIVIEKKLKLNSTKYYIKVRKYEDRYVLQCVYILLILYWFFVRDKESHYFLDSP